MMNLDLATEELPIKPFSSGDSRSHYGIIYLDGCLGSPRFSWCLLFGWVEVPGFRCDHSARKILQNGVIELMRVLMSTMNLSEADIPLGDHAACSVSSANSHCSSPQTGCAFPYGSTLVEPSLYLL
jgi:hypothetical protein